MILFNGKPADFVPAWDRALHYGDGVFRTLKVVAGRAEAWSDQYAKLERDCAVMTLDCPPETLLAREVGEVAAELGDCAVKIIVSRGVAQRGYAMPRRAVPNRMLFASPLPGYPDSYGQHGVAVRLCETRYAHQPRLAGIKHLNRLENVLARSEWEDTAIAEGLMLDQGDLLISGTMSNLFMVIEGRLVTPALVRCGIAGVQRERVMRAAQSMGIPLGIEDITLIDMHKSSELFLCNSLIGLWPVVRLGEACWKAGPVARQILEWLNIHV